MVAMSESSSLGLSGLLEELLAEARPQEGRPVSEPPAPASKSDATPGQEQIPRNDALLAKPRAARAEAEDSEMEEFFAALGEQERRADLDETPHEQDEEAQDEFGDSLVLPGLATVAEVHTAESGHAVRAPECVSPSSAARRASAVPRPWGLPPAGQVAAVVSVAQDANTQFRTYMEDGHKLFDPLWTPSRAGDESWSCFAVYDGHGGRDAVDYCESKMHEVLLAEIQSSGKDICNAVKAAFQKLDGQLAMLGAWAHGCTATVALVHRQKGAALTLYVANVGDSRAVLLGNTGVQRVSTDHRPDDPAEVRRVEEDGGKVRNGRVAGKLAVSRSLGDHHLKNAGVSCVPDICSCGVASGHALILASDGLWDAMNDQDASDLLEGCVQRAVEHGGGQAGVMDWLRDNAAQAFVDRAKELGSRDNILVVVLFF